MKKVVAIYHKDCSDGTAAAAVILKKFPESNVFPLYHSYTKEDLEPILALLDNETGIYTVDCVMGVKEILDLGFKVTSIDHHGGLKVEFENLAKSNSNYTFIFDNNKSGSSLAWSYFFPNTPMPELIKYVEDMDLWKMKYGEETENIMNYVSIFNNDPKKFLEFMDSDLSKLKEMGSIIGIYKDQKIEEFSQIKPIKIKISNHEVLAFNIVNSKSEMGHIFSQLHQQTVLLYSIDGENVKLSFRSFDDYNPSALELARELGGGGHNRAAGGKIPLRKFLGLIKINNE